MTSATVKAFVVLIALALVVAIPFLAEKYEFDDDEHYETLVLTCLKTEENRTRDFCIRATDECVRDYGSTAKCWKAVEAIRAVMW